MRRLSRGRGSIERPPKTSRVAGLVGGIARSNLAVALSTMPKTVCIVGVAGFIGSHLLEKVIRERDWSVIGVDMVEPTKIQQLLGAEKKWASRFEFHQMNIVKAGPALNALIARSDVVVNLAAICNPSEYIKQPVNTINSNFTDAQDCINFCVEHDKHLIHFSTCEVYGRTLASYGLPKDDPQNYILDEETTPMIMGPVSAQRWCYACAKQLVERLVYAHGTENNLKFTIVRPYNWIGPRMDYIPGVDGKDDGQPRVLASFMTALMKGDPLVLVNVRLSPPPCLCTRTLATPTTPVVHATPAPYDRTALPPQLCAAMATLTLIVNAFCTRCVLFLCVRMIRGRLAGASVAVGAVGACLASFVRGRRGASIPLIHPLHPPSVASAPPALSRPPAPFGHL